MSLICSLLTPPSSWDMTSTQEPNPSGSSGMRRFINSQYHAIAGRDGVAVVAEWYRYRTVACFVTGSSPVPLKTRRVGQRCTLNLSRAETSSRWCGVVVRRGMPAQVSSTSLDHGSKLRGPSPNALV
ncbi:uncharacterized protein TNCV_4556131 [Trichonephila clavipes]|nr:uncharacterized protein TNCV_4556131 [Trichonephila clavipes]